MRTTHVSDCQFELCHSKKLWWQSQVWPKVNAKIDTHLRLYTNSMHILTSNMYFKYYYIINFTLSFCTTSYKKLKNIHRYNGLVHMWYVCVTPSNTDERVSLKNPSIYKHFFKGRLPQNICFLKSGQAGHINS